jgi:hypothetical protein
MKGSTVPNQVTNITGNTTNGIFMAIANSTSGNQSRMDDWITPTPGTFFGATLVLVVITVLVPLFLPATFTYIAQKATKPYFRGLAWWAWLGTSFALSLMSDVFTFQFFRYQQNSYWPEYYMACSRDEACQKDWELMSATGLAAIIFNFATLGIMSLGGCWWYYYTRSERPGFWRRMWLRKWYTVFWFSLLGSALLQVFTFSAAWHFWGLAPYIVYFLVLLGRAVSRCYLKRRGRAGKQYSHLK